MVCGAGEVSATLDVEILNRFGHPVTLEEWFLVPLSIIQEAVDWIKDGSIAEYVYDPKDAQLKKQT